MVEFGQDVCKLCILLFILFFQCFSFLFDHFDLFVDLIGSISFSSILVIALFMNSYFGIWGNGDVDSISPKGYNSTYR